MVVVRGSYKMNYTKHYNLLIERARDRSVVEHQYYEEHHIIPKCLGGSDDDSNLVKLTAPEHFLAHQLLVKMYPEHPKLVLAVRIMTKKTKFNGRVNNKMFGWLREKANEVNKTLMLGKKRPPRSKEWSDKIAMANTGKSHSEEHKAKISSALLGVSKSDTMRSNMSKAAKNRSPEHRQKLADANRGRVMKESTKQKIKDAALREPIVTCPHCGKQGKLRGMKCWHFDRCKHKDK